MSRTRSMMLALALGSASVQASPAVDPPVTADQLRALRAIDGRLAGIAYRLTTANAALCRDLVPNLGLAIQSESQYPDAARAVARGVFRFDAPIAVEALVPGGPAARAAVGQDDSILAVNDSRLPTATPPEKEGTSEPRDAALADIARQPADAPMRLTLLREGRTRIVVVTPVKACPSSFEVLLGGGMDASADGAIVQIAVGYFERYGDDDVAAIVAHELSHNILRHRIRLKAAGVKQGLLAELGRNGRLTRLIEDQADQLSVSLLYNAGYDPDVAVRFWQTHGGEIDGGIFRSRTHASSSARAKAIAAEIATIPPNVAKPYIPPVLAERDVVLNRRSFNTPSRDRRRWSSAGPP